jgi:flagellar biosynthesis/type III secretory pathway chaperone
MRSAVTVALSVFALSASGVRAQAPAPAIQTAAPATVAAAAAPAQTSAATAALLQSLQQIKATNDELLKKQAATLQQLDELSKAAEQIKIYGQRS